MKHLTITLSLILGLATSVSAEWKQTPSNETYFDGKEIKIGEQIICEEREAVGFKWRNGDYQLTNFKPDKYLFTKQEHRPFIESECKGEINIACLCPASMPSSIKRDSQIDTLPNLLYRCYQVKDSNGRISSDLCAESYTDGKLRNVSCEDGTFTFHPNQLFLHAPHSASKDVSMFPENDYKDTYLIAHGSCRVQTY